MTRARWLLGIVTLPGLAGCIAASTEVVTPPPPPPAALTVHFAPDPADGPTAEALGWAAGLPDAEVSLTPQDGGPATTFRTSATGTIALAGVAVGDYRLEFTKLLTPADRGRLAAGDDALGFRASTFLLVQPSTSGTREVPVPAERQGSVVISEWSFNAEVDEAGIPEYGSGGFLEVYNNADTTVYLDGLVIGQAFAAQFGFPNAPCGTYDQFAIDPNGLWARFFERLPGTGQEYPLAPGATAVLATEALDHSKIVATGLDLSGADFEFKGFSDADNPAVPNSIDIGVGPTPDGHGLSFFGLGVVPFLTAPLDPATLVLQQVPGTPSITYALIPAGEIRHVMAIKRAYDTGYPECGKIVADRFDRQPIKFFAGRADDATKSYQRRVAFVSATGRKVLQVTRTTAADFVVAARTPGRIP